MPATLTQKTIQPKSKPPQGFAPPRRAFWREEAPICFRATPQAETEAKTRAFEMQLYSGGPVNIGFGYKMIVQLEGMTIQSKRLPIYANHKPEQLVGYGKATNSGKSLQVEGEAIVKLAATRQIIDATDGGMTYEASMGFEISKYRFLSREDEPESINGRTFSGPGYIVTKSTLIEGSIVPAGADGDTSTALLSDTGEVVHLDGEPDMADELAGKDPVTAFAEAHKDAVQKWIDEGRKLGVESGVKQERERFAALKSKFSERPAFVCEQFAKGNDVAAAAIEFADIAQAELKAAGERAAQLAKKQEGANDGHEGVGFGGSAAKPAGESQGRKPGETDESFNTRAQQLWDANYEGCRKAFSGLDGFKWALEHNELDAEAPNKKK